MTEQLSGRITPDPVLTKGNTDKNTLVIAILTYLDEASEAELVQHFQEILGDSIKIHTWKPSRSLLQSIAKQGPHLDSQANLYALAVLAYRSERSAFLVADELTRRQLTGERRVGESDSISVVMISTKPQPSTAAKQDDEVIIVAKRTNGDGKEIQKLLEMPLEPLSINPQARDIEMFLRTSCGLALHDPDRAVLTADTASSLGREKYSGAVAEALSTSRRGLPVELVTDIVSRADSDSMTELVQMPVWERAMSYQHLVIFLFFPASEDKLHKTQSIIQDAVRKHAATKKPNRQNTTVELIPWERHRLASRRKLATFYNEYRHWVDPNTRMDRPLHFLREPIRGIDSAQFGSVFSRYELFPFVRQNSLEGLVTKNWTSDDNPDEESETLDINSAENLSHPDEPFYYNPPPWMPSGSQEEEETEFEWLAAFYLTNQLTKEQDESIQTELKTKNDIDEDFEWVKEIGVIPWKSGPEGDVDGTIEDIWEIVWKVWTSEGRAGNCGTFACVDQQSAVDQTVILVDAKWYHGSREQELLQYLPSPTMKGFRYTRVAARDAHLDKINLDIANMGIDECGEGAKSFRRPDWPSPELFDDDDDDEDENDDGNEDGE
ncbi:hypothetical protein NUU61_002897 [Penicillium alfredii]|uniref:Uncharacterized protein n=1 Tax=Penicillium alfredii TaxID=1506179 RepID=A0A9W9FSF2_9EURO|nr:uncharacterized protein NUU61_002897 [Penicillium alfredii]KAJ5105550.1 hypothetical protein NUU61_002897 [Penicillium alfredii]